MERWAEAPDRVGVVVAARAWRATRGPEGPRLVSITRAVTWPVGSRLEAHCLGPLAWWHGRPVPTVHEVPHPDCSCGIWGLAHGGTVLAQHRSPAYVFGAVSLWGPLLVGRYGWRARFAYPQALVRRRPKPIPGVDLRGRSYELPSLEELAAAYGVPLLDDWPELSNVEPP